MADHSVVKVLTCGQGLGKILLSYYPKYWTFVPLDFCTVGRLYHWTFELSDFWNVELLDRRRIFRQLDFWTVGLLDHWTFWLSTFGPLDFWTVQFLNGRTFMYTAESPSQWKKWSKFVDAGDNVLMYPAGSGIAKVSTEKYSQEIISLANKV